MPKATRHANKQWSNQEDATLIAAVTKYGKNAWGRVASMLHYTGRTAAMCETRWNEYLSPTINHAEWSDAEDQKLLALVAQFDSSWRSIAQQLPGRTPTQAQARHGFLLEQHGGSDEAAAAAGRKFLQMDNRAEVKAARLDTIDGDEAEKLMLDEARARLANTQGRKGLRKQRERAALAAKQRTAVQRHREMRAAAAAVNADGDLFGEDGNENDDDFVPVSTAEADYGSKAIEQRKKQAEKGNNINLSKTSASSFAALPHEIAELKKNLDSGAVGTSAAVAAAAGAVPAFSFGASASTAAAAGGAGGAAAQQPVLRIPQALQEKMKQRQRIEVEAKLKQAALAATSRSKASSSVGTGGGIASDAVLSALRDGGRTRRQTEALLRSGATTSLVQWSHEQYGVQLPLPNPKAIAEMVRRTTDISDAEALVLKQAAKIVEADKQLTAHPSSAPPALFVPSQQNKYIIDFDAWAEECGDQSLIDAAALISEEQKKLPPPSSNMVSAPVNVVKPSDCQAYAAGAAALIERIRSSNVFRAAAKNNSHRPLEQALLQHSAARQDAERCRGAARLAEAVRSWEQECLLEAYRRAATELQQVKAQADRASEAALLLD